MTRLATDRLLTAVIVAVGGLVVAVLAGEPEVALLAAPWTVLLIFGFARSQSGKVDVQVAVDADRLIAGDEFVVTTTIDGMSGSALISSTPSDAFWSDINRDDHETEAAVHEALRSAQTIVDLPLRADQWGVHDVGHIAITFTEPYGLFRWSGEFGSSQLIRVHPQPAQIRNLLSPWLVRSVTGAHGSKLAGRGVEYADIRPFTSGDSLREINWKATARSEDLWVSQRHPERATDVVLLVDSFVESGHDVRTVFGLAIEGAIALAESHLTVADRVGLVDIGGTVRWLNPSAGRHQLTRLIDTLLATGLYGHEADRNLALWMSRALPPRSFVVALTPLLDERFIDALFILVAHGHDVAVIECATPRPVVDDGNQFGSGLATRMWEAERQAIRDRLTEHGIAVATWHRGDHLDLTLSELISLRRLAVSGRHR